MPTRLTLIVVKNLALNGANADKITSFEHHMRLHLHRRDNSSGAKKETSNAVNL